MIQKLTIIEQLEQKIENPKDINDFEPKFWEYTYKDGLRPRPLNKGCINVILKRKYRQKLKSIIYV